MSAIIQKPAPAFAGTAVKEGVFEEINLEQYKGKWVVLFFYPMDFTFVCPTEILAFNAALEQFAGINTEVIGVSTDSEFTHLAWSQTPRKEGGLGPDLKLTLLADRNHAVSKAYGVLLPEEGIALRGTFFIDPKGTLRASHIHDLPVGRSVEETIRVVKAFQFTDEHGEVCPAGWEEGKDTIDTSDKSKYFSKQ
ncbi:thiol-specific antioxidant protein 1 [Papiliotrema laurentii]|uniref:thioredoxin-dependent peroxiredoxin n=1 Tax=Papiliotrema laurentii TaxID=5418 RepID=A0AAD9L9H0_PAPLA|nr:thiol-specific antioxidant protein 1 [Papiliotrema laurentii]